MAERSQHAPQYVYKIDPLNYGCMHLKNVRFPKPLASSVAGIVLIISCCDGTGVSIGMDTCQFLTPSIGVNVLL